MLLDELNGWKLCFAAVKSLLNLHFFLLPEFKSLKAIKEMTASANVTINGIVMLSICLLLG